jgi:2-polyprenyl-3-methyl-5-hydroxy-6-metoxy-1,4-benzoquinol methylase
MRPFMQTSWEDQYSKHGQIWGERPSELALFVIANRQRLGLPERRIDILDIGCGYGRDAIYMSQSFPCRITGIDNSEKAIALANELCGEGPDEVMQFRCCAFRQLTASQYDVVFMSNLYQVLRPEEREWLRETVRMNLRRNGHLFLSTLSVNDPEHYGRGEPVANELNSFIDVKYVHLCTRQELEADFDFIDIQELFEHEYDEPRTDGVHHHISWILYGRLTV